MYVLLLLPLPLQISRVWYQLRGGAEGAVAGCHMLTTYYACLLLLLLHFSPADQSRVVPAAWWS
jgi:hypothetical protein